MTNKRFKKFGSQYIDLSQVESVSMPKGPNGGTQCIYIYFKSGNRMEIGGSDGAEVERCFLEWLKSEMEIEDA